jgi:hypothetical protein
MRGFPVSDFLLIMLWYKNEEFDRCKIDQECLGGSEIWCWRKKEKISFTELV